MQNVYLVISSEKKFHRFTNVTITLRLRYMKAIIKKVKIMIAM